MLAIMFGTCFLIPPNLPHPNPPFCLSGLVYPKHDVSLSKRLDSYAAPKLSLRQQRCECSWEDVTAWPIQDCVSCAKLVPRGKMQTAQQLVCCCTKAHPLNLAALPVLTLPVLDVVFGSVPRLCAVHRAL